ncbi:MAG: hypothetical protein EGP73_01920 [Alistipes indistinctus]|uniref:hypothetical protein n=1 Tax=Alistipes indistinctus TaxID=626932 RepID=UPI00241F349C|nr:hypothetical protein [Alistipes indistinctus]MBD9133613.1 hypothetical protein [Alistipes indistinctus]
MRDNHFFKVCRALRDHTLNKVQAYFERWTPRQRKIIVIGLLGLFAAVDLWLIAKGFSGGGIVIEHIETIEP